MTEYLIICLTPLSKKRKANIIKSNNLEDAIKISENQRRRGNDAIIIRKDMVKNNYTERLEDVYVAENYGYYKTYDLVNKIIFSFVVVLILGFLYLYYKYLNNH